MTIFIYIVIVNFICFVSGLTHINSQLKGLDNRQLNKVQYMTVSTHVNRNNRTYIKQSLHLHTRIQHAVYGQDFTLKYKLIIKVTIMKHTVL